MVLAIGFFTPLSLAAAIFYITHHIVVKSSLFMIGGVATSYNRSDNLDKMGGLWEHAPWLGVLFLIQALSLAGVPPLSGFWGKYVILVVGFEQGEFVLVAAAIGASLLTLFSMLKIWNAAFWSAAESVTVRLEDPRRVWMSTVIGGLTVVSVGIGLGAELFIQIAIEAAERVLDVERYTGAVLGPVGNGVPR
jgi:multicomponent Na+:H+ antiporter subunit D